MKKYEFTMSTYVNGSTYSETIEFDDNVTEWDIQMAYEQWVWENLDGGFKEIKN